MHYLDHVGAKMGENRFTTCLLLNLIGYAFKNETQAQLLFADHAIYGLEQLAWVGMAKCLWATLWHLSTPESQGACQPTSPCWAKQGFRVLAHPLI